MRNSRIATFFLIAYGISWTAWIILFAQRFSPLMGPGRWLYLTAVLAPHGAALRSTTVEGGRSGVRAFYSRVMRPLPFRSAIVTICVPPIMYLMRDAIFVVLRLSHGAFFHSPPRTVTALVFGQLAVVLGEEPGWRGFALPRLIHRLGPNAGTLILGIGWALWHLPLYVVAGTAQYRTPFTPFLVMLVAWSMVISL